VSTKPVWTNGARARTALQGDARADVCVIGAGAAGLGAAYMLASAGKSVVVLDERDVGAGESGRSTAHLSCALDLSWPELERLHGAANARLAAESHAVAIKRIAKIAALEEIDCAFEQVDGFAFTADRKGAGLETELAGARRAGVPVEWLERAPLDAFDTGPCLRYPRQAHLDPASWLRGLAHAVTRLGGRIFAGTRAVSVQGGARAEVATSDGRRIRAGSIIVATNSPFNDRIAVQAQQTARRTYALALEMPEAGAPRSLLWDDESPYHYVRSHHPPKGPPLLLVGGEDHPTGREDDGAARWERLESWARARFLTAGPVAARWSGQVLEPADGLALIGRNPLDHPNVYIATGHSGNGMTYGMIAGMLLGDLILGRPNEWAGVYDPSRVTPEAAPGYAETGLGAAIQYADWLLPGEGPASRDPRLSPVCPHLGGRVRWNSAENSWDCPVHGSRFDARGRVLNGPACADLEKLG
jgi:glycine/D-amino acid oxidase-like deaminating enzyme